VWTWCAVLGEMMNDRIKVGVCNASRWAGEGCQRKNVAESCIKRGRWRAACVCTCVEKSGTNDSFGHDSDALATMVP
jgi:hypothetical protein